MELQQTFLGKMITRAFFGNLSSLLGNFLQLTDGAKHFSFLDLLAAIQPESCKSMKDCLGNSIFLRGNSWIHNHTGKPKNEISAIFLFFKSPIITRIFQKFPVSFRIHQERFSKSWIRQTSLNFNFFDICMYRMLLTGVDNSTMLSRKQLWNFCETI